MSLLGWVLEKIFGGNVLEKKSVNEQSQISKNSVATRKSFLRKYGEHSSGRFIEKILCHIVQLLGNDRETNGGRRVRLTTLLPPMSRFCK
jgi:hypothetical protein